MSKRCFVISPIGEIGSHTREHADDVFDFIIKPAMDELGIEVYRADHSQQIGRITEQMFNSILGEDLCVAILTFFNPNVFYELAVAQCAARPVIILIEKGQTIPFDVHDLRAVEYDLRPRPLRDKVYVKQIVDLVRSLDLVQWSVQVPFGKDLSPLGNKQAQLTVYDRIESYGTSDRWISLVRKAAKSVDLSGISLRWWTKFTDIRTILLQKAEQGCKIRCLLMHPDNPSLLQLIKSGIKIGGLNHMATEIQGAFSFFSEIAAAQPAVEVRQIRLGFLSHQVVKNDDTLLLSIILHSQSTSQYPLFECRVSSPLFKTIEAEFNALWSLNGTDSAASLPLAKTSVPLTEGGGVGQKPALISEDRAEKSAETGSAKGAV
jgi:hypothetical protein